MQSRSHRLLVIGSLALLGCSGPQAASGSPSQAPSVPSSESPSVTWVDPSKWIAYYGDDGTGLVRVSGEEDQALELDFEGSLILANWSPDGARLVMTSRTPVAQSRCHE